MILQYMIFRIVSKQLDINVAMRNISFFLYTFLYLKEDIYSFKTYLIWDELKKQLKCFGEYLVIISIIVYHIYNYNPLWKYIVLGVIVLVFSLIMTKVIRIVFRNYMKRNVVILGTGDLAKELYEVIKQNNFTLYNFLGFVDTGYNKKIFNDEIISGTFEEILRNLKIDEVIIADNNIKDSEVNKILDFFYNKVSSVKIIPNVNRTFTITPEIQDYDSILMLSSKNLSLSRKRKIIKRLFDILVGIVGCLLLIPLTLIIWLKTDKSERKYGIFFTQDRIGKNGKKIKIYKYRSMVNNAENILEKLLRDNEKIREEYKKNKKIKNDPRITKIGRFLRKTSLDEFPQFINVLLGNMSFIGPRPYLFDEIEDMKDSYNKIIKMKPGITGMWQTHGRSETDFQKRLKLDEYYYRNWSLWLDIIILIKTIKSVLRKKGAY